MDVGAAQRGPTDPRLVKGPSLLTRKRFGAKPSEWDRFKDLGDEEGGNLNEDDNPFNDPFKYHPFKGMAFPPTDYIGPDDIRETDDMGSLQPGNALRLAFVYGYTSRKGCRSNLFYNKNGHIVYHAAALGIVYDKEKHEQWFFHGHDDDITALDIHPDTLTIRPGRVVAMRFDGLNDTNLPRGSDITEVALHVTPHWGGSGAVASTN